MDLFKFYSQTQNSQFSQFLSHLTSRFDESSSASFCSPFIEIHQFYLLLQNLIKCLKYRRVSSHPERMIGRKPYLSNSEKTIEGNTLSEDKNFRLLIEWIWLHKDHLFQIFPPPLGSQGSFSITSISSVSYFQLSLLLDLIKEFKKVQSYQLHNFSFEFIFHWMSTHIPHLNKFYLPNCTRLMDILQAISQLVSKQFSIPSLSRYLENLLIFHYSILQINSQIFPSSEHLNQQSSTSFIDSSSLLCGLGPALFSLQVELLGLIVRQYGALVEALTSSSTSSKAKTVVAEDLSVLMSLHNQLLSSFSHLLSSASQHYKLQQPQSPLRSSDLTSFSWNLISHLSENDKTLLSTLNSLEEVYVSLELFQLRPPALFESSAAIEDLCHRTALALVNPLNFSRENLLIYFCQCLCYDELTLLDLISHNETVGLQYFLRLVKYLDRARPSDLKAACQALTRTKSSTRGPQSQKSDERAPPLSWNQLIQDYCSGSDTEDGEREQAETEGVLGCCDHAAIWIKSETLLPGDDDLELETVLSLSHQAQDGNNPNDECRASIPPASWRHCPRAVAVVSVVSQESINVFSEYSSTELFQKVLLFLEAVELKLEEMETQQLLPFNPAPLLKRLRSANRKYQESLETCA
jgi:hypothetical protein